MDVKGLLIEEYMKRAEKNKKQESDNALFKRVKLSYQERFQPRGGAGGGRGRGRGGRFRNFSSNAQSSRDDRVKHKGVKCCKCNQNRHIVKSKANECIYVNSVKEADGRISLVIRGVYVDEIIPV